MGRRLFVAKFPRSVTEEHMLIRTMAIKEWFQDHCPVVDAGRHSTFSLRRRWSVLGKSVLPYTVG